MPKQKILTLGRFIRKSHQMNLQRSDSSMFSLSCLFSTLWFISIDICIANTVFKYWNGIVPAYTYEMFKPSLCRYSTSSLMALDVPLRKTNTGQKSLSSLGSKIWSKIGPSIKNVKTLSSFMPVIKKNILPHLQKWFKLLPSSYDWYYDLILIATLFLFVIIGILLSRSSWFNF